MSFYVFVLILAFVTIFGIVSIQARRMALLGLSPWSIVPVFLAKKLSAAGYVWACLVPGWFLVIVGGLIYNSNAKEPGGIFWAFVYFLVLVAIYAYLWIKNRHVELKP